MGENQEFAVSLQDSKAAYVLSNVAEVVERILTFVPTKSLLRIARYRDMSVCVTLNLAAVMAVEWK